MTTLIERTSGLMAFVRSVESGSFSGAARLLGTTPSAITKSVAKLERRLGTRLLQRSTRGLSLTDEGSAYYDRVARLVRELEEADDSVQKTSVPRGALRVSAPVDFGRLLLAPWASGFLGRFTEMRIELLLTDRNVDLVREGVDVAVRVGPLADSALMTRMLGSVDFVACAAPRYLAAHGTPKNPDDLAHHNCLRYLSGGRPTEWQFTRKNISKTISPAGSFDTDDGGALVAAASAGAGIAYVFRLQAHPYIMTGELTAVLDRWTTPSLPVYAVHTHNRYVSPRIRAWTDYLHERFQGPEPAGVTSARSVSGDPASNGRHTPRH